MLFNFISHLLLPSTDEEVDAFSLRHGNGDPLDLHLVSQAGRAGVASGAGGKHLGDGLPCLLADLVLVETATVDKIAAELAIPDVQGLGLYAPGVGCELNADAVGKLGLEGGPVGDLADKLGLRPVPLLGHSGETLVEVFLAFSPVQYELAVTK